MKISKKGLKILTTVLAISLIVSGSYAIWQSIQQRTFRGIVLKGEINLYSDLNCTIPFPKEYTFPSYELGAYECHSVYGYLRNEASARINLTWRIVTPTWEQQPTQYVLKNATGTILWLFTVLESPGEPFSPQTEKLTLEPQQVQELRLDLQQHNNNIEGLDTGPFTVEFTATS